MSSPQIPYVNMPYAILRCTPSNLNIATRTPVDFTQLPAKFCFQHHCNKFFIFFRVKSINENKFYCDLYYVYSYFDHLPSVCIERMLKRYHVMMTTYTLHYFMYYMP